jgi:hypothetical protein
MHTIILPMNYISIFHKKNIAAHPRFYQTVYKYNGKHENKFINGDQIFNYKFG